MIEIRAFLYVRKVFQIMKLIVTYITVIRSLLKDEVFRSGWTWSSFQILISKFRLRGVETQSTRSTISPGFLFSQVEIGFHQGKMDPWWKSW